MSSAADIRFAYQENAFFPGTQSNDLVVSVPTGTKVVIGASNADNHLSVAGEATTAAGPLRLADGSNDVPSLAFSSDADTGICRLHEDTLTLCSKGNDAVHVTQGFLLDVGQVSAPGSSNEAPTNPNCLLRVRPLSGEVNNCGGVEIGSINGNTPYIAASSGIDADGNLRDYGLSLRAGNSTKLRITSDATTANLTADGFAVDGNELTADGVVTSKSIFRNADKTSPDLSSFIQHSFTGNLNDNTYRGHIDYVANTSHKFFRDAHNAFQMKSDRTRTQTFSLIDPPSSATTQQAGFDILLRHDENSGQKFALLRANTVVTPINFQTANAAGNTKTMTLDTDGTFRVNNNGAVINGDVVANNVAASSDDRVKSDETLITGALETLSVLRPQEYNKWDTIAYESDSNASSSKESGLIAQEIFIDAPALRHVVRLPEGADKEAIEQSASRYNSYTDLQNDPDWPEWVGSDSNDIAHVYYSGLVPYTIRAIQELDEKHKQKDDLIASLVARIEALEQK